MSRVVWAFGAFHGFVGSAILFFTFHPLRDVLDAHALALAVQGSTLQAIQGLALIVLASRASAAAALIALGTTIWSAMLYVIIFTGQHPFDLAVPIGGMIMLAGWAWLLISRAPDNQL